MKIFQDTHSTNFNNIGNKWHPRARTGVKGDLRSRRKVRESNSGDEEATEGTDTGRKRDTSALPRRGALLSFVIVPYVNVCEYRYWWGVTNSSN